MNNNINNNFNNNNYETKNNIVIGYVMLTIIILGLVGYIIYDKDFLQIRKNIENSENLNKQNINIDYNVLYEVGKTLEYLDSAYNETNTKFTGYIYTDKKLLTSKFNKEAALFSAIHKELVASNTIQSIPNGTIKRNFERMYGKYLTYEISSIEVESNYNIFYNQTSNSYQYTIPVNTNIYLPKYYTVTVKTEVDDENITVTRKIFYAEYNGTKASIYKDAAKKDVIGQIELRDGSLNEKEVIDKYSLKLKTYEYRFKMRKNDEYVLHSIERIK